MDVTSFDPPSMSKKRKLAQISSSSSSTRSGKAWIDDGVEDGEDTDEMDLEALKREYAEEDKPVTLKMEYDGEECWSPKVTQVRVLVTE